VIELRTGTKIWLAAGCPGATVSCSFLTLNVASLMMTGNTRLDILIIAMSHPHPECLPVRLSTAMRDTIVL
jgi:hypothetical protein